MPLDDPHGAVRSLREINLKDICSRKADLLLFYYSSEIYTESSGMLCHKRICRTVSIPPFSQEEYALVIVTECTL